MAEKIIAILVNRMHEEADEISERVVAGVASLNLPDVAPADGSCVTVSIGVATQFPPFTASLEKLVSSTTVRYKAKHQGRLLPPAKPTHLPGRRLGAATSIRRTRF